MNIISIKVLEYLLNQNIIICNFCLDGAQKFFGLINNKNIVDKIFQCNLSPIPRTEIPNI